MKPAHPHSLCLRLLALAVAGAVVALSGHAASAQVPRTIKLVVPFSAGGPTDITGRVLAEEISRAQGVTMVVENRTGAGGQVGIEAVARAPADGSTLLLVANGFVVMPHVRKPGYDPFTSFEAICLLVKYPNVIVTEAGSPYRTLPDLIDAARAHPGDITMASVGPGSGSQISVEMLKRAAKVDMTFVPFPGYSPAINALLGNHLTAVFADYSVIAEQYKAGKVRVLAVGSAQRMRAMPDVPTIAEFGFKDYEAEVWYGLFAPAHTPAPAIAQFTDWFKAALRAPEVEQKLVGLGLLPNATCGADFAAFVRKQYDDYGAVIRAANIKAE